MRAGASTRSAREGPRVIAGLVLAGGAGRRFGSPKQLAELDGVPLLQHAVDAMLAVPALDRVVVVLGAAAEEIGAAVKFASAEPIVCPEWDEGMAASLRCGVEELAGADWVVVTLGDMPGVTPEAIEAVIEATGDAGDAGAVRARYGGRAGHPVALGRALLARIGDLRGDVGARELLRDAKVRDVEAGHLARADDIDTPAELEAIRA
jgi:CTP:molybdopterin cytidylyltransferase MocA